MTIRRDFLKQSAILAAGGLRLCRRWNQNSGTFTLRANIWRTGSDLWKVQ